MTKEFKNQFFATRDYILSEIRENSYNWNKFINYWSNILDDYSVDNILNLYSYNSSGRTFKTFDDWNSEEIDRRIKPKSKGIPIILNERKSYVFDIRQTYGKEYNIWHYSHYVDKPILDYYQDQVEITNDNDKSINENFYNVFYELSLKRIMNNYFTMDADEVEFIAKTMTSLFLAKSNFNIYNLPSVYEMLDDMETDDILKCMQIANKETAIIYKDFIEKADSLETVQNYIQTKVLFQYKEDEFFNNEEKETFLSGIETTTPFNLKVLTNLYDSYINRYEMSFKKQKPKVEKELEKHYQKVEKDNSNVEEEIVEEVPEIKYNTNVISSTEQLSLFTPREEELASKICDIFNSFDTKYQNTFEVHNVELQKWEHIKSKKKELNYFTYKSVSRRFWR